MKGKEILETHPLSPQEQPLSLSTTVIKARDNRGIPTTHSVVGSWQLTQVGVKSWPLFEVHLLKGDASFLCHPCPACVHGAAAPEKSPGVEYLCACQRPTT